MPKRRTYSAYRPDRCARGMRCPVVESLIGLCRRQQNGWKSGSATVELAITAPLLVVLVLGAADYGALTNSAASLEGATRAVAEFARNSTACGGGLTTTCTTGISSLVSTLQTNNTSLSGATFTPSTVCTCVDGATKTCPAAGGTNPCSSSPAPTNPATGAADSAFYNTFRYKRPKASARWSLMGLIHPQTQ